MYGVGPRILVDPDTNRIQYVIDNRFRLPGQIPCAWDVAIRRHARQLCDLTAFATHQLHLLAFRAIQDMDSFPLPLAYVARCAVRATGDLVRILGQGSVTAAESLFMILFEFQERMPTLTSIPKIVLQDILEAPTTGGNYYFKIKLIDAWMHNLHAHEENENVEKLLQRSLEIFRTCSDKVKGEWDYTLDPILDILEFCIVFYQYWTPNPELASQYKREYLEYFEESYGDECGRLTLGCGVGVFGCSFSRLRFAMKPQPPNLGITRSQSESRKPDLSHFQDLRTLLGPAGSSLPGDGISVPRYVEQEWCHFRFQVYLNIHRLSLSPVVSQIGSGQFLPLLPEEGIPPQILQAEEDRLRSLLRPYSELIEAAQTIGDNVPEREVLPELSTSRRTL